MEPPKRNSGGLLRSFSHAFRGVGHLLVSQRNAKIHAAATVLVIAAGICLRLSRVEWALLIVAVVTVWAAEALNTSLEFLADAAVPDFHPRVKKAKDVAAAGVLIAAIGSVAVGLFIFGPRVLCLLNH